MIFSQYLAAIADSYDTVGATLHIASAPASASETARLLQFGVNMPQLLIDAYRLHDGSDGAPIFARRGLYSGWALMPISTVLNRMAMFPERAARYLGYDDQAEQRDARIRPGWFRSDWLPFAEADGGSMLLLDFDPGTAGTSCQVIEYQHDPDQMCFVADSFERLLADSTMAFAEDGDEILYDLIPD